MIQEQDRWANMESMLFIGIMHRWSQLSDRQAKETPSYNILVVIGEVGQLVLLGDDLRLEGNLAFSVLFYTLNSNIGTQESECLDRTTDDLLPTILTGISKPFHRNIKGTVILGHPTPFAYSKSRTIYIVAFSLQVKTFMDYHMFPLRIIFTQRFLFFILEMGKVKVEATLIDKSIFL